MPPWMLPNNGASGVPNERASKAVRTQIALAYRARHALYRWHLHVPMG